MLALWYAIPCGLCVLRARSGYPSGFPRVSFVCVRACALAASAPLLPIPGLVCRAVPVLAAGRAVPRGPCPSASPASVQCSVWLAWGGSGLVPFLPTRLGAARSPWGGCGLGDPSPTPPRALSRAGFARCWGGTRLPGRGASSLGVGRPGLGALPAPTTRPFGRAARAHCPLAVGAGGAGLGTRHQSHSARSCELALRAVGAARGRQGGAPLAWVWGVRGRALSHPDHSSFWASGQGSLPTGCGCRGCGAGDPPPTRPRGSCELAFRALGASSGFLGGGRLSRPRPPVFWGVRPGPTTHRLWVLGFGRGDPSRTPQRALLRAGFARCGDGTRAPREGCLLPGCGASGVGHSPTPHHPPSGACGRGPLPTGCGCGGCGRGDPSPTSQRVLLRAGLACCGGRTRAPGGAPLAWVWNVWGRALSHPRPLVLSGVRARQLPTGCGCRGCGRGDPSPTPQRALLRAGFARCGGGTRAPGGGASCLGVGRPGMGALPPPTTRPFGRAAGANYPLAVGAGPAGPRTRHKLHRARSCELALRALEAA